MKIPHQVAPPPSLQRQFWGRRGNVLFFFSKIWNIQMFGSREKPFYFSFHLFSFWRCRLKFPPRQPNETHTSKRWGSVRVWGKKAWITGHASLTLLGEMYRECANDCWFKKKTKFFCCWIFFPFQSLLHTVAYLCIRCSFIFYFQCFCLFFFDDMWKQKGKIERNWGLSGLRFYERKRSFLSNRKNKKEETQENKIRETGGDGNQRGESVM